MASRLSAIRTAVKTHITTGFTAAGTVTFSDTPVAFDTVPKNQMPFAVVLFVEDEPERLDFKQERRRISGHVIVGILRASDATVAATREIMDLALEDTRDAIFADPYLLDGYPSETVDDVSCEAAVAYSSPEDPIVYGTIDISTEEVF